MSGKGVSAGSESRDVRARRGAGRGDAQTAALLEALDRLRDLIFRRLDQLEALAAEQADRLAQSSTDREDALRDRVVQLEAAQARLQAELKRREQEWHDTQAEQEDDRKLLTEAWERLERERIAAPAAAQAGGRVGTAGVAAGSAPAERAVVSAYPASPDSGEVVTREILRQFQTLKGDVRRNAGNAGRPGP